MLKIIISIGSDVYEELCFEKALIGIGSDESNDVVLPVPSIQACHAVIRGVVNGAYLIETDPSAWLMLNGRKIRKARLSSGDELRLASFILKVEIQNGHQNNGGGATRPEARGPVRTRPEFIVHAGEPNETKYSVNQAQLTIGRGASNDIILDSHRVLMSHARLVRLGEKFYIEAFGNGTSILVNEESVPAAELNDGDVIAIGPVRCLFSLTPEATVIASELEQSAAADRALLQESLAQDASDNAVALIYRFDPEMVGRICKTGNFKWSPPPFDQPQCSRCGLPLQESAEACQLCGASRGFSSIELQRAFFTQMWSNFDPWDAKGKNVDPSDFEQFFQKARLACDRSHELEREGDPVKAAQLHQKAVEFVQMALHENPARSEAWAMLAELKEKLGDRQGAAECLRELRLISPETEISIQKYESLIAPARPTLKGTRFAALLMTAFFWWATFWIAWGVTLLDRQMLALICLGGGLISGALLFLMQGRRKLHVKPVETHFELNLPPIHETASGGIEEYKRVRQLREVMQKHLRTPVPAFGLHRLLIALTLSLLFLIALGVIAIRNGAYPALLAWPAVLILTLYLFDIFPRAFCGYLLLQHFVQETGDPWADPHLRIIPAEESDLVGEFGLRESGRFPHAWAMRPFPYRSNGPGFADAIHQTMVRHLKLHHFYQRLRVTAPYSIPLPFGFNVARMATLTLVLVSSAAAGQLWFAGPINEQRYERQMKSGFDAFIQGQHPEARQHFSRAATVFANRAAPWIYMGHSFAVEENAGEADAAFLKALEIEPDDRIANNDYANFLQRHERPREAVRYYERALDVAAADPDVLNNLGAALMRLGDYSNAERHLAQAVEIDPRHPFAHTNLGQTYEHLQKLESARRAYETALKVAPAEELTNVAKARLERNLNPEDLMPISLGA